MLFTYELSEASHRQPTGSCYKLKQTDSLFVVHLFHHLQEHTQTHDHPCTPQHMDFIIADCVFRSSFVLSEPKCPYLPEPVNLLAVLGVMSVDGVLLPVSQIDLLHPTQHQLQHTHKLLKASQ